MNFQPLGYSVWCNAGRNAADVAWRTSSLALEHRAQGALTGLGVASRCFGNGKERGFLASNGSFFLWFLPTALSSSSSMAKSSSDPYIPVNNFQQLWQLNDVSKSMKKKTWLLEVRSKQSRSNFWKIYLTYLDDDDDADVHGGGNWIRRRSQREWIIWLRLILWAPKVQIRIVFYPKIGRVFNPPTIPSFFPY